MARHTWKRIALVLALGTFGLLGVVKFTGGQDVNAQIAAAAPTPPPVAGPALAEFDQAAALAKLREQIKGRENEPAEKVFKNTLVLKQMPAGRLLAVMEMGYARSLGVNCTHCHVPDKWESEDKPQKQIARDMWAMMGTINTQLLKNIKNLKSETPTVNCTTCHRGQVKPALNFPPLRRKADMRIPRESAKKHEKNFRLTYGVARYK